MSKRGLIYGVVSALFVLSLAGCGSEVDPDAPLATYEEREVLFVDPDDLHAWIEAGHQEDVVFIDNRNMFTYEQQRISGARLVPTERMERSIGTLPLNKWLILYCT